MWSFVCDRGRFLLPVSHYILSSCKPVALFCLPFVLLSALSPLYIGVSDTGSRLLISYTISSPCCALFIAFSIVVEYRFDEGIAFSPLNTIDVTDNADNLFILFYFQILKSIRNTDTINGRSAPGQSNGHARGMEDHGE